MKSERISFSQLEPEKNFKKQPERTLRNMQNGDRYSGDKVEWQISFNVVASQFVEQRKHGEQLLFE